MTSLTHRSELPPFSHDPAPYNGPNKEEVRRLRQQHLTPSLLTYYKDPIMIVEGRGQYLFDETGRRYLDGFGGIVTVSVGHCHPTVTGAGMEQMARLQHTTNIYLHPGISQYAQELAGKFPGDLSVCYFVNSGSEANDLAVLMARAYTGNYDVIALRNGYHGGSSSAMGLTAHSTWKYNVPHSFGFHHSQLPDTYRGPWGGDDPDAGRKYAHDVEDLIHHGTSGQIAAFCAETIQGVGGVVELPQGYLMEVYRHVRSAGGLCIADEVQTGFGRTGSHYWGFETQGVVPDIVTLAKGIGNGAPLAAVVTTPAIAHALTSRIHFNTFGGNPVSCAMGRAVLRVIDEEKLQDNCQKRGDQLLLGLTELQNKHGIPGIVRGRGLMLGIEFVQDNESKTPARAVCDQIWEMAKDHGLLLGKGGFHGNTLRIKPPMCWTEEDSCFALSVLDYCFSQI